MLIEKRKIIFVWDVFVVSILTGGFAYLFATGSGERSDGNLLFQLFTLICIGPAIFFYLAKNALKILSLFLRNWPLFLLCCWIVISAIWSAEASTSLRRSISLFLCILYALHLVAHYDSNGLFRLFYYASLVILLGTILSVILGVGLHTNDEHAGALKGFAGHKNSMGLLLAVGVILAFINFTREKNFISFGVFVVFLSFLISTGSQTSLGMCVVSLISYGLFNYQASGRIPFSRVKHAFTTRFAFTVSIILGGIAGAVSLFAVLVDISGRDLTFSGRNKIWNYALNVDSGSGAFGAGFKTFWIDYHTSDFFLFNPYWGGEKVTANGHSGYLDIYLELGLIGSILFLIFLVSYIKRIFYFKEDALNINIFARVAGPLLIFSLLYNIFETSFLTPRMELLWFLFVVIYFYLGTINKKDTFVKK